MTQDFMPPRVRFAEWIRTAVYAEPRFMPAGRIMYDDVGPGAAGLVQFNPEMVAGYDTGGPNIVWTPQDWMLFPGIPHVHIDQGGAGAPSHTASVIDVEPGAWRPPDIPAWVAQSTAPVPTVYCDRTDLPAVQAIWNGPIWLAWPGWNGEPLPRGNQIVAVQNVFANSYDSSVVFDNSWPGTTPPPPPKAGEMINGTLDASVTDYVPFTPGAFSRIYLYHDFTVATSPLRVRVAIHSVAAGYTVVDHDITHSVPEVVHFVTTDVDAVSLVNQSTSPIGWTLA